MGSPDLRFKVPDEKFALFMGARKKKHMYALDRYFVPGRGLYTVFELRYSLDIEWLWEVADKLIAEGYKPNKELSHEALYRQCHHQVNTWFEKRGILARPYWSS